MSDRAPPPVNERAERQFERLAFFSDAVFAIAITLLVLDLKPPNPHAPFDLRSMEPSFEGFAISFFVISLYWLAHHQLFGSLLREDRRLRVTNLWFLASVAFLPYPTSVIGSYDTATGPVIFYALSVATVGVLLVVLTWAARRPADASRRDHRRHAGIRRTRPRGALDLPPLRTRGPFRAAPSYLDVDPDMAGSGNGRRMGATACRTRRPETVTFYEQG